ncbi:hypothetical protein V5O48_014136 [Marasmius crinis-equi]|uniref:RING-type domain-containing protein n=1 Tax=Marasmius crinis-equi TaxID=585013 RepID=A0ABR3EYH9_9AGAR
MPLSTSLDTDSLQSLLNKRDTFSVQQSLENQLKAAREEESRLEADIEHTIGKLKCYECTLLLSNPHVLQCGHSCCAICLTEIKAAAIAAGASLGPRCPQCQAAIFLPPVPSSHTEAICARLATEFNLKRRPFAPLTWPKNDEEIADKSKERYLESYVEPA